MKEALYSKHPLRIERLHNNPVKTNTMRLCVWTHCCWMLSSSIAFTSFPFSVSSCVSFNILSETSNLSLNSCFS